MNRLKNWFRSMKVLPKVSDKHRSASRGSTATTHLYLNAIEAQAVWSNFSRLLTICCCGFCLSKCLKLSSVSQQQAWREKIALICLIAVCASIVGFFAIGLKIVACPSSSNESLQPINSSQRLFTIGDALYRSDDVLILFASFGLNASEIAASSPGSLVSYVVFDQCLSIISCKSCRIPASQLEGLEPVGRVFYDWSVVEADTSLVVFNNVVLNISLLQPYGTLLVSKQIEAVLRRHEADVTLMLMQRRDWIESMRCFTKILSVASVGTSTLGCQAYAFIMYTSLFLVLGIVVIRFILALWFHWMVSPKLVASLNRFNAQAIGYEPTNLLSSRYQLPPTKATEERVILFVTVYSEDKTSISATLNSLCRTDYPDALKLLFVVVDGLVKGQGNAKTSAEYLLELMNIQNASSEQAAAPKSYQALATGRKQHNRAFVHSGVYEYNLRRIPMVLVVKCGSEEGDDGDKPGNRGKRDSQLILMNFLSRVIHNDRMTALDYELFTQTRRLTGATPDEFAFVLMVDADTFVAQGSLRQMVNAMTNDQRIMGLCGETRIANKRQSCVTMIQVYEYFISHHLGKAFESVFGSVTCLPGCFCMYRVYCVSKEHGTLQPLLVHSDIVNAYSENVVETLHKKNLLLLGEDRYLTTLMLRTFPCRRMVYIPQAVCHTSVPSTFSVLLSQRRRWINSTIHNLLELVLVSNLCGIFCFSMNFVIALELFGTVTFPAAFLVTVYLLVTLFIPGQTQPIPLLVLVGILFLPAILIVLTTRRVRYIWWMVVYFASMPLWSVVMPLYSFWHFDDFGWGETRRVEQKPSIQHKRKLHPSRSRESMRQQPIEVSNVEFKHWVEWEKKRRGIIVKQPSHASILQPFAPPVQLQRVSSSLNINVSSLNDEWNVDEMFVERVLNDHAGGKFGSSLFAFLNSDPPSIDSISPISPRRSLNSKITSDDDDVIIEMVGGRRIVGPRPMPSSWNPMGPISNRTRLIRGPRQMPF